MFESLGQESPCIHAGEDVNAVSLKNRPDKLLEYSTS
jgi:hypothetical protein